MDNDIYIEKFLPLSESTYYILLMLIEPLHGYGIMQKVEAMTGGRVVIGPGTLYGAFSTLEKEKLIILVREEGRRKFYTLTDKGRKVLRRQFERLEMMTENGRQMLAGMSKPVAGIHE